MLQNLGQESYFQTIEDEIAAACYPKDRKCCLILGKLELNFHTLTVAVEMPELGRSQDVYLAESSLASS